MKKIIIKYYSKINYTLFIVTLIFAIIPLIFNLSHLVEYNLYQIMILSFLLTEICDIVVSDDTINLTILKLNYYSKIITPVVFLYNFILLYILNTSTYFSFDFYDYSSYFSMAIAFIPNIIRVRKDKYYLYRLLNKK